MRLSVRYWQGVAKNGLRKCALKIMPEAMRMAKLCSKIFRVFMHSRPQRPRSAPRITTSGQVQRHSGFEWLCKHNRLRPEPIRFGRLGSEHAQSDGKSVNRGLPVLEMARGRDSWC